MMTGCPCGRRAMFIGPLDLNEPALVLERPDLAVIDIDRARFVGDLVPAARPDNAVWGAAKAR